MDRRTWDVWKFALAGFAGAILLEVAESFIARGHPVVGTAWVLLPTGAALLVAIWAYAMAMMAVRGVDEYQLAAGKFAWYWGGSAGMGASVIGYAFIALGGLHWLAPTHFHLGRELFDAFRMGYVLGIGTPVVGFLIARLWWGLAHR